MIKLKVYIPGLTLNYLKILSKAELKTAITMFALVWARSVINPKCNTEEELGVAAHRSQNTFYSLAAA